MCCNRSDLSNPFPLSQVDRSDDFIDLTDSLTANHRNNAVSLQEPIIEHQESQPQTGFSSNSSTLASLEAELIVQGHDMVTQNVQHSSEALTATTSLTIISN